MEKKDKASDQRLFRTYGIRLSDYDEMLKQGGGGCWICGKPPKPNKRHHIDHDHRFHKAKINIKHPPGVESLSFKKGETWLINTSNHPTPLFSYWFHGDKKDAKQHILQRLKRQSVRGILCWPCNRALRSWNDNPDRMEKAAAYIRRYQEKLVG
jgi:hypothetical protein